MRKWRPMSELQNGQDNVAALHKYGVAFGKYYAGEHIECGGAKIKLPDTVDGYYAKFEGWMPEIDYKCNEYVDELQEIQNSKDYEQAHVEADKILCDLLRELGYGDVVDEWEKVEKHYA
jgi:hypothetical protein